jgi:hypothetical protein
LLDTTNPYDDFGSIRAPDRGAGGPLDNQSDPTTIAANSYSGEARDGAKHWV